MPQPPYQPHLPQGPYQPQVTKRIVIGGMVTGIVGLVFGWYLFQIGFILGLVAVILSGVGLNTANTKNGSGRGMAMAGLVCGILAVLFELLWIAVLSYSLSGR
ncbi:DUF4190 domain-containing protein [Amycolatopsis taiwanensis]|uniref:DUF4190 domain-containing protein n=1 Tax=Amycolatopsis taiwanensis TaxID=342230 RepID=A0A9W6R448_9PSEU|nr:DUF4190 domain-containing protein [Amycolatopsis taiwanensis]GLY69139.1 hypothetical protein Atai01_57580 [Amycolatopsis taiwanensis]